MKCQVEKMSMFDTLFYFWDFFMKILRPQKQQEESSISDRSARVLHDKSKIVKFISKTHLVLMQK